jgi:UDP:flavonoid glycosyltransferase YjiC (YdhE family)
MPDNLPTRKILILVWPETSAYNATFRLARVLSQHGYEIVYAMPARWQAYVARQGFNTVEIKIQAFISSRGSGSSPQPPQSFSPDHPY